MKNVFDRCLIGVLITVLALMVAQIAVQYPSNHGGGFGYCLWLFSIFIVVAGIRSVVFGAPCIGLLLSVACLMFVFLSDCFNINVDYDTWVSRGMPNFGEFCVVSGCIGDCDEDVLVVSFEPDKKAHVRSVEYRLQNTSDAYAVRADFMCISEIRFENFQYADAGILWNFLCFQAGGEHRDFRRIAYSIMLREGTVVPLQFAGPSFFEYEASKERCGIIADIQGRGVPSLKIPRGVGPDFSKTYLKVLVNKGCTPGSAIVEVIEQYVKLVGQTEDVFVIYY